MPKVRLGKPEGEPEPPVENPAPSKADAMALLEEAEAEAAEAEALAAAARARARVARLRREVQAKAEAETAEAEPVETAPVEAEPVETAEAETAEGEAAEADPVETAEAEPVEVETIVAPDDQILDTDGDTDSDTDDAEESDSEETGEDLAPKSRGVVRRRRLPSLSTTLIAAAIIVICALVGVTGYMLWYNRDASERQQRAANFIAGARQGVVNMTSLDFNRAKEDVQRLLDCSTGEFRDDFQQRAKDFVKVVEQSKVVTQGTINATAVESMNDRSASVLVAATSRITNAAGAKDEPRVWRLRVTVTEEGGQYKMSKLEFIA